MKKTYISTFKKTTYTSHFTEALPLGVAKNLAKLYNPERLKDWFDGKKRIYIPLEKKVSPEEVVSSGAELLIKDELEVNGFELVDYKKGLVKKKGDKREMKLGGILNRLNKDLLKQFELDPTRSGSTLASKQPIVVISRHPYDIAGMSTDRGWDSCKNLGTPNIYSKGIKSKGLNSKYLTAEVISCLIAYLIRPDDKNIETPIGRVLIIPYVNETTFDVAFDVPFKIYPKNNLGSSLEGIFVETVKKWLVSKQGNKTGKYKINPAIYDDDFKNSIDIENGEPVELIRTMLVAKQLVAKFNAPIEIAETISMLIFKNKVDSIILKLERNENNYGWDFEDEDYEYKYITNTELRLYAKKLLENRNIIDLNYFVEGLDLTMFKQYLRKIAIVNAKKMLNEPPDDDDFLNELINTCYNMDYILHSDFLTNDNGDIQYNKCLVSNNDLIKRYVKGEVDNKSNDRIIEEHSKDHGRIKTEKLIQKNNLFDIDVYIEYFIKKDKRENLMNIILNRSTRFIHENGDYIVYR